MQHAVRMRVAAGTGLRRLGTDAVRGGHLRDHERCAGGQIGAEQLNDVGGPAESEGVSASITLGQNLPGQRKRGLRLIRAALGLLAHVIWCITANFRSQSAFPVLTCGYRVIHSIHAERTALAGERQPAFTEGSCGGSGPGGRRSGSGCAESVAGREGRVGAAAARRFGKASHGRNPGPGGGGGVKLSDAEFDGLKAQVNSAIHELVFACQHLEQGDLDDALTCITTAQGTIEAVAVEIASREAGEVAA